MLLVNDKSAWQEYFNQESIQNCDICICKNLLYVADLPNDALITKSNILSFSIKETNKIIPTDVPSMLATLKVIGWDDLDSDTQDYLSTKGNYVKIFYCVENDYTQNAKIGVITDFKVDRKNFNATITIESPFVLMDNRCDTIYGFGATPSDTDNLMPFPITLAQQYQLTALGSRLGIYIPAMGNDPDEPHYHTDLCYAFPIESVKGVQDILYLKNVYDWETQTDKVDKSNVVVYGWKVEDEETTIVNGRVVMAEDTTGGFVDGTYYDHVYKFPYTPKELYTNIRCEIKLNLHQQSWDLVPYHYWDTSFFNLSYEAGSDLYDEFMYAREYLYGYKCVEPEYPQNDIPYIFCSTLLNEGAKCLDLQTKARDYWSNNELVEIDCRFDPRLECADTIYIEEIGKIVIEEYKLDFNGGFKGHIVGRKLGDMTCNPVSISNMLYDNVSFSFRMTNTNNRRIRADFYYGNTLITSKDLNPNIIANITQSTLPDLMPYFVQAFDNELEDDVYITTNDYYLPNLKASTTTLLIEKSLVVPEVVDMDLTYDEDWSITIRNNNNKNLKLHVHCRQGEVELNILANSDLELNHANADMLEDSISTYLNEQLLDDVYAYFEDVNSGRFSNNEIVLEANG